VTREPGDLPACNRAHSPFVLTVGAGKMNTNVSAASAASLSISQRLVAGVLSLVLSLALIGGVGFASDMAVHNGAHDTRHSLGFPCH
jgi:cobalt transporter subunit CbtB